MFGSFSAEFSFSILLKEAGNWPKLKAKIEGKEFAKIEGKEFAKIEGKEFVKIEGKEFAKN